MKSKRGERERKKIRKWRAMRRLVKGVKEKREERKNWKRTLSIIKKRELKENVDDDEEKAEGKSNMEGRTRKK